MSWEKPNEAWIDISQLMSSLSIYSAIKMAMLRVLRTMAIMVWHRCPTVKSIQNTVNPIVIMARVMKIRNLKRLIMVDSIEVYRSIHSRKNSNSHNHGSFKTLWESQSIAVTVSGHHSRYQAMREMMASITLFPRLRRRNQPFTIESPI